MGIPFSAAVVGDCVVCESVGPPVGAPAVVLVGRRLPAESPWVGPAVIGTEMGRPTGPRVGL